MDTIFMNPENSKTSDLHGILPNLSGKSNLKRSDKYVTLLKLSICYTWKNIKMSYKNNKIKILAPTWNGEFELRDGLYSLSDIQYYFEYIIKKHQVVTDNPSIMLYINKSENRITLK